VGDNGNTNRENGHGGGQVKPRTARPTIGFLVTELDEYQSILLSGVLDAIRERDVNLLCLAGGYVQSPDVPFPSLDTCRTVLYELAGPENVDGIIAFTGGMLPYASAETLERFLEQYAPLPVVTVGTMENYPSVSVEYRQGMQDMVTHLTSVHGFGRIAFIRGPADVIEEHERYQAYVEVLAAHDIPLEPGLVTPPGEWNERTGRDAVDWLLDEQGLRPRLDLQAIVGANDVLAIGALERLNERGIRVPYDVAVVGFDDIESTQFCTPPLTTVHQPIAGQARRATEALLAWIDGGGPPDPITMPAHVLVRRSCGCTPQSIIQASEEMETLSTGAPLDATLAMHREDVHSAMIEAMGTTSGTAKEWTGRLLDAFTAEVGEKSPGAFIVTLDEMLRGVAAASDDAAAWQDALSALRRYALSCLSKQEASSPAAITRLETLFGQARILIGSTAQQVQGRRRLDVVRQARALSDIGQVLSTTLDVPSLMDSAARELPQLGIPSCFLSLYEDPRFPAEWSRLHLAYRQGKRIEIEPGGMRFPSRELVPGDLLPRDRRYSMIVEPLYFQTQQIGFALFEMGPSEGMIYESLRERFSSGLQGAILVRQSEERGKALQDANYALQRRAIQLEASAEVAQNITSIFDVTELMRRTVDLIRDHFEFYHAAIFLLDDTKEWAVLQEATGDAGARMKAQGHQLAIDETSMVGWTALHRQPRIALDVGTDPVRFAHPLLPHTRSEMTLPLLVGDQLVGVLNVQSTEEAAFDEDDVRVLQSMSRQVAVAIENARRVSDEAALLETASPLYRASRLLTTATTTTEVADAIIASVSETGADGCLVVEFEFSLTDEPSALLYLGVWRRDRRPQFQPGLRIPVAESPFPLEMVSTLWIVNDVEADQQLPASARDIFLATEARALVNIPLRSGDKVIGQVVVIRSTSGAFPEPALRLYEALSDQAAVALERAQLLGEAQRYAQQEQETRQTIGYIRQATDVEQALHATAEGIARALEVPHVSLELSLTLPEGP
jgi:DNA-binding LacI/PurR family transcriptional regulator/GAF domain-containing protein